MKKNTRKNGTVNNGVISEIKEEFKRHTNVLMEQMKHEVKTVAEGHGAIMRKLEEHDKRFDEHDKRFDEHDKRFDEHDKRFDEHDKKFAKIESELQSIRMAVMEISHDTKGRENRIKKLEEKVFV